MAARPDTWMPMYWGDYLRDTMHLRTEGHGAYLLLIAAYWTSGEPLPDDDDHLMAITRLEARAWKRIKPSLQKFFAVGDGVWRHGRIDGELERATRLSKARQEAGKRGGKRSANARADGQAKSKQNTKQETQQSPTPSQSPSPEDSEPNGSGDADAPPMPAIPLNVLRVHTDMGDDVAVGELLWKSVLAYYARATGKKPDTLRSWLGKLVKDYGAAVVVAAAADCERNAPAGPTAWTERRLSGESASDNTNAALAGLHAATVAE